MDAVDLPGGFVLREARGDADFAAFAAICRTYLDWCRARFGDLAGMFDEAIGHQAVDAELADMARKYGPPSGRALLLERHGEIVGAGAYCRMTDGACEMKRLYVADTARGLGLGRRFVETLIELARSDGFTAMRLDTGHPLVEAIALYRALGFRDVPVYHDYPTHLLPHLLALELTLE